MSENKLDLKRYELLEYPHIHKFSFDPGLSLFIFPSIPFWFVGSANIQQLLEEVNDRQWHTETHLRETEQLIEMLCSAGVILPIADRNAASPNSTAGFRDSNNESTTYRSFVPTIVIEATRLCNLHCRHCFVKASSSRTNELSLADFEYLFQGIAKVYSASKQSPAIWLMGGEPLLRDDIIDILSMGVSYGFQMGLVTNGTQLKTYHVDSISNLGVHVAISIDGQEISHDWLRSKGAFRLATKAIMALVESGVCVDINYCLYYGNTDDLPHIANFALNNGVNRLVIGDLAMVGRAMEMNTPILKPLPRVDYYRHVYQLVRDNPQTERLLRNTPVTNTIASLVFGWRRKPVGMNLEHGAYVCSNGDIYPGNYWQWIPDSCLGNVKTQSWDRIILKQKIPSNLELSADCRKCEVRYYCAGDRYSEHLVYTGTDDWFTRLKSGIGPHFRCNDIHSGLIELMWLIARYPAAFRKTLDEMIL